MTKRNHTLQITGSCLEKNELLAQKICTNPLRLQTLKGFLSGTQSANEERKKRLVIPKHATTDSSNTGFFHILPCLFISFLLRLSMHSASISHPCHQLSPALSSHQSSPELPHSPGNDPHLQNPFKIYPELPN